MRALRACQAVAAEPVELDAGLLRAVARQQLDVLDRQEQLVAAGVMDFQAVVRRAGGLDGAQADEAADAVIDVDDEVAGGEARHLGDEILRALRLPARAHQPLAQNVLLGDERDVGGLEAGIEAEHGERDLVARESASACGHEATGARLNSPCSASTCAMRSREPSLHSAMTTRLPAACSASTCCPHRLEDVGAGLASLGGEIVPGAGADLDRIGGAFRRGERRQPRQRGVFQALAPFGFGQIEPVRRQRLIGRAAAAGLIERVLARLIIIGDLRQPLVRGFFRQRLDHDRCSVEIIEQRVEARVKQRQPMLDAGGAAAVAHRLIEHVVGTGGAERRDIAGAKLPDRLRR